LFDYIDLAIVPLHKGWRLFKFPPKKEKPKMNFQRNLLLLSRLANVSFAGKQKGGVDGPGNIIATCAD
jgi:hypothetical protein